jgi:pimeloyl-ACP methyl ester carboxylesterase
MRITHGRHRLELHELAQRDGAPLLLLHALFGSSDDWGETAALWPGSVYALDFPGHGGSDWLRGGAYYPESLVADADAALRHVGRAAVAGAGLGAYVALLLAGARSADVPAALLLPGAGLFGAGPQPDFDADFPDLTVPAADEPVGHRADPMVRVLECFPRPPAYVEALARAARRLLLLEDDGGRPPWWAAARRSPAATPLQGDVRRALRRLARTAAE